MYAYIFHTIWLATMFGCAQFIECYGKFGAVKSYIGFQHDDNVHIHFMSNKKHIFDYISRHNSMDWESFAVTLTIFFASFK